MVEAQQTSAQESVPRGNSAPSQGPSHHQQLQQLQQQPEQQFLDPGMQGVQVIYVGPDGQQMLSSAGVGQSMAAYGGMQGIPQYVVGPDGQLCGLVCVEGHSTGAAAVGGNWSQAVPMGPRASATGGYVAQQLQQPQQPVMMMQLPDGRLVQVEAMGLSPSMQVASAQQGAAQQMVPDQQQLQVAVGPDCSQVLYSTGGGMYLAQQQQQQQLAFGGPVMQLQQQQQQQHVGSAGEVTNQTDAQRSTRGDYSV